MRRARSIAALASVAALTTASFGQDFSYPDFSNVTGLVMNGAAGQAGNVLQVTPNQNAQSGSCFYDQPTRVALGFTTTFTFQFTGLTGGGADGMTFIIQNDPSGLSALGDDGSGMGYAANSTTAIANCIAVELDTWNSGLGDPDDDHVSVHTSGTGDSSFDEAFSLGRASVPGDMSDGSVHTAVISYVGGVLEVFVDDTITPLISVPYDFATGGTYTNGNPVGGLTLVNGDSAYVGFTAGTGGANENHDVLSWKWADGAGPIGTPYCFPSNLNSTNASATISGYGSSAASANAVMLTASQMPQNQTGYFITSMTQGFVAFVAGSQGNLCLGGAIGRYNSSVLNTGAGGEFQLVLDLMNTPTPHGPTVIQPGETWNFQAWFIDANPTPTFNFTDGVSITFL